jgi:protein-disulfide isomerase
MDAFRGLAAGLALTLAVAGTAGAKPATNVPKVDWRRTVAVTPQGGFRMGNPNAKIAIVEYGSLTCPHCRHFAETAVKPLVDGYVRTGKASYEFRPFVLNGLDLVVTLIARCNGPSHFFPLAEQLYATQPAWEGKVLKLPDSEQQRIAKLPQDQMLAAYANVAGILPMAAGHGIAAARAQVCLKDAHAADRLMDIERVGSGLGVTGTPTFFINGKKQAVYDWVSLQPFLKGAGG